MDEVTKTIISIAAPVVTEPVKQIITTWLKPKVESLISSRGNKKEAKEIAVNAFTKYLSKTYEEQRFVNVIALGLQQIQLEQIYIPVKLRSSSKINDSVLIKRYMRSLANKYKRVAIVDHAGMGKSTVMKKLFISCIEENAGIPVFIELKYLSGSKDIIDIILEKIDYFGQKHQQTREIIIEVINRGDLIFFLDGYDEIPFKHKQAVTYQLKQFILNANQNIFFLTSRPDDSIYSFGQFKKFSIEGMSIDEAYSLFRRFDTVTELSLSENVINHIEGQLSDGDFGDLELFLANPLLASFLYLTYKHKMQLPTAKIEFYEKVYDALYELHDLSKDHLKREKYSKLSKRKLQKVLMKFAFLCLTENTNEYDKSKLLQLIFKAKSSAYFNDIDEEDILKDLLETVPLLTKDGLKYKWAHKSFMEYFSAYYIDEHEKREVILQKIFDSSNFHIYFNTLEFYSEINRKLFDKIFVYPMLNEFITFIQNNEKNISVEFLELVFNKFFIVDNEIMSVTVNGEVPDSKTLNNLIKSKYPDYLDDSTQHGLISLGTLKDEMCEILLFKSHQYRQLILLLNRLRSDIVKNYDSHKAEIKLNDFILSCDNLHLSHVLGNEKLYTDYILASYGDTDYIYSLDYKKVLEYKFLIEEELKNHEDGWFSIL